MNEIEEEFFKVFSIEPKNIVCPANFYNYKCNKSNWGDADCVCDTVVYPEIITGILVNMLCSLNKYKKTCQCRPPVTGTTFEKVKECIFKDMIDIAHKFSVSELNNKDKAAETLKKEVRELFEK